MNPSDVQPIHLGGEHLGKTAHGIHRTWDAAVSSRKSIPYIPKWLAFVRDWGPLFSQPLALINSFFIPKADIYLLTGVGCVPALLFKKGKVICINSDPFFRELPKQNGLVKWWSKKLLKRIDGFISTSYMMKELADKNVKKPSKVAYGFVDVKRFSKVKPDLKSSNICSVGLNVRTKGTDILLDAFKIIKKKYPKTKLFVCGDDDNSGPLRDFRKTLLKEKDVVAPGKCNPVQYFKKCGVYINASRHESFGANIVEAMCAGLPTVITETCGAKELVKKVDKKLIAKVSADDIAEKALGVLKKNKKSLSLKSRKISKNYTSKNSVESFKKAFYGILDVLK